MSESYPDGVFESGPGLGVTASLSAPAASDPNLQLKNLLPPGKAWTRGSSVVGRVLEPIGKALRAVQEAFAGLTNEADPRTTDQLLEDWERAAGLPDPCAGAEQTLDGRRQRLTSRLAARGGQSAAYFISVAASLGYAVTIEEYRQADCNSDCVGAVNGGGWPYAWTVHAPLYVTEEANCTSYCNGSLRIWGNEVLECVFGRLKPAHTIVLFSYGA